MSWKWNEHLPGQLSTMPGRVVGHEFSTAGDLDWSLFIVPDDSKFLVNTSGNTNPVDTAHGSQPFVECEVCPPDSFADMPNDAATEARFADPFVGQHVTVTGAWVDDTTHEIFNGGKTEIHSCGSVILEGDTKAGVCKRVRVLVVSDSSKPSTGPPRPVPPLNGMNFIRDFTAFVPPPPDDLPSTDDWRWNSWRILEETDAARAKSFSIDPSNNLFTGHVESGVASEGKGFYHAVIELGQPAVLVSQAVPGAIRAGGKATVSVTIRNTSPEDWQSGNINGVSTVFSLVPAPSADVWGVAKVPLPSVVGAGQQVTCSFTITAPAAHGLPPFGWQVLRETFVAGTVERQPIGASLGNVNVAVGGLADLQITVSPALPPIPDGKAVTLHFELKDRNDGSIVPGRVTIPGVATGNSPDIGPCTFDPKQVYVTTNQQLSSSRPVGPTTDLGPGDCVEYSASHYPVATVDADGFNRAFVVIGPSAPDVKVPPVICLHPPANQPVFSTALPRVVAWLIVHGGDPLPDQSPVAGVSTEAWTALRPQMQQWQRTTEQNLAGFRAGGFVVHPPGILTSRSALGALARGVDT